jgi:hypothetical protein
MRTSGHRPIWREDSAWHAAKYARKARASAGSSVPWSREFDDPIQLPGRRLLVTLRDAGGYIAALPRAEQESPEWQAAAEALIMAAEDRGPC